MYQTSKYYSYIFYTSRNVRPCMILGYTLTAFPKSCKTSLHNQSNRNLWHHCKRNNKTHKKQLHRIASSSTLHNWWRISGHQVFYTARKQLNKNKEGGNLQPSKQQGKKRTTLSFVCFSLFISKVNQAQVSEWL